MIIHENSKIGRIACSSVRKAAQMKLQGMKHINYKQGGGI
jgi:hypothetical protein